MNLILFLSALTLAHCDVVGENKDKLVLAQVIFRHGDRTIQFPYSTDPYKDSSNWPEGFGQLINKGKQRAFELGQYLRRRYAKLLGDGSYSPDKVFAVSSAMDRTINSASLVLAGLFPPQNNQIWNKELAWQPIPVYVIPKERDYLIIAEETCDRYEQELNNYEKSSKIKNLIDEHRELLGYAEQHAGQPIRRLDDIKNIFNILEVEMMHNKTLPEWTQKIVKPGGNFEHLAAYWFKFVSETTKLKRLKSGFLLKEILDRFQNKSSSTLTPDHSLYLYSGHDTTVATMLNTLGLFDTHMPPYSSSILFELYKSNDDFYVQIFYRNTPTETLLPLNIPKCGTKCSINQLYELYSDVLPSDFETECSLPTE